MSEYQEFSVSFVAQNSTPADEVTISEFPRQTFRDLPSFGSNGVSVP